MAEPGFIYPDWQVSDNIRAVFTTRVGGRSQGEYSSFNLGLHVNDSAEDVAHNRQLLISALQLPAAPVYLNQVHGVDVVQADEGSLPDADACWTEKNNEVLTIMTADCLPVLFASHCGRYVAGAHAGWRGLANGVLEATISKLPVKSSELHAWLGPAIGPTHFEVGAEVREQFVAITAGSSRHFSQVSSDKYLADLYGLATDRLQDAGVRSISGGTYCTYSDEQLFYSHRRDKGKTGRMAALIWKA